MVSKFTLDAINTYVEHRDYGSAITLIDTYWQARIKGVEAPEGGDACMQTFAHKIADRLQQRPIEHNDTRSPTAPFSYRATIQPDDSETYEVWLRNGREPIASAPTLEGVVALACALNAACELFTAFDNGTRIDV